MKLRFYIFLDFTAILWIIISSYGLHIYFFPLLTKILPNIVARFAGIMRIINKLCTMLSKDFNVILLELILN